MKRVLVLLVAAMMVVGFAGQAMAGFDLSLALYGGVADVNDTNGNEVLYGLSDLNTDVDGSTVTTTVTLDDLQVSSWDDVSAAVVGTYTGTVMGSMGFPVTYYQALFTTDLDSEDVSVVYGSYDPFSSKVGAIEDSIAGSASGKVVTTKNEGLYLNSMGVSGDMGTLANGGNDGTLAADDELTLTLMSAITSDSGNSLTVAGYLTLNTSGDILTITYSLEEPSQVPVPGAFILLGSALMGIVGIRRKNS